MNPRNSINSMNSINSRNSINFLFFVFYFIVILVSSGYAAQPSNPPPLVKGGEGGLKIALFPFENLTEDKSAPLAVMPLIRGRLEARGLEVLDEAILNRFLLKERIRSTGYISKDMTRKTREEVNVKAILVGSINSFSYGENPQIGLSARLIDSSDGIILWADHVSATGEDFTSILGLGRIKELDRLIPRVIDKLFASFSARPPYKELESTYRIAVMPFQNISKTKDAGMIAAYMFIAELFKSREFVPVEYGEVRHLLVDLRIRARGELNLKSMKALSVSMGVDGILVGTVELYNEGAGAAPPEAAISARLLDARKDKILLYDSCQLDGDDDVVILDWGRIRSAENVAYKAVSKLVKKMGKTKWR
jgi:TolB-like protein